MKNKIEEKLKINVPGFPTMEIKPSDLPRATEGARQLSQLSTIIVAGAFLISGILQYSFMKQEYGSLTNVYNSFIEQINKYLPQMFNI